MTEPSPAETTPREETPAAEPTKKKGRLKAMLLPLAMHYAVLRQIIGIQVTYRSTGGGLIVGGLAYAALFALIPTLVLVIAGIFLLVDDPQFRRDAIDLLTDAFPAFAGITDQAVEQARDLATVGGVIALIGFFWGASGLYLNLTRAMERFFPGERVSGALARVLGVVLVFLIIIGVLAAVLVAGVVTVIARALQLDSEWLLAVGGALATFLVAGVIVYAIYRVIPSNPPSLHSARLPATLVGVAIALLTLLYSLLSPWLVSAFHALGVAASIFAALLWLRLVFLAMVYGAAMARYRDFVLAATILGQSEPDSYATDYVVEQEQERARREVEGAREIARRQAGTAADSEAKTGGAGSSD